MAGQWNGDQQNDLATIRLKNLSSKVDEELLFELGTQFGVVKRVNIPIDQISREQRDFGFIEFEKPLDALYMLDAISKSTRKLMLFEKDVSVDYSGDKRSDEREMAAQMLGDHGARIEVSGLDSSCFSSSSFTAAGVSNLTTTNKRTEEIRSHFSQFGMIAGVPQIEQIPGMSSTTGGGIVVTVSFTDFEYSDKAIEKTNGSFLWGKKVQCQYALKEDGSGERYGSAGDRAYYAHKNTTTMRGTDDVPLPTMMSNQQQPTTSTSSTSNWASGLVVQSPYENV